MNTTPEWAEGLTTSVEIQARQMASVIRWSNKTGPLYIGEMKRLCRLIEANQTQPQKEPCQQPNHPSHEDASHSTAPASGAVSEATSGQPSKSSAPAVPTVARASAKTTTTANAPAAKRSSAAKPAARHSATPKADHAKTAAVEPELLSIVALCGVCKRQLDWTSDGQYLKCTRDACAAFHIHFRLKFTTRSSR